MGTSTTASSTAAAAAASARRVGVADYFTILGIGETMIWKHAQKKSGGATASPVAASSPPTSGNADSSPQEVQEEDDAALLERFYREIVDVSILAIPADSASNISMGMTNDTPNSHNNLHNNSLYHAGDGTSVSGLAIPPSISDVTSAVTGTDVPELNGFTVIRQTCPTESAEPPPPLDHSSQQQLRHTPLWARSQVFDANLNPTSGLSFEIQATYSEVQKRIKESGSYGSSGSASISALKDIQRKVKSKLPLLHRYGDRRSFQGGGAGGINHLLPKFYIGLRRRAPDESDRPAIADLQLRHVRMHKSTLLHMRSSSTGAPSTTSLSKTVTSGGSTGSTTGSVTASSILQTGSAAAALMGRVAVAGKNVVRDRVAQIASSNLMDQSFDEKKEAKVVDLADIPQVTLEEFLDLPHGFDEWSIPDSFRNIRLPPPPDDDDTESHFSRKTLLFPPDDDAMTNISGASDGSGVGVEAVEAPRANRSSPRSEDQQNESPSSRNERRLKRWKERILPKLVQSTAPPSPSSHSGYMEYDDFLYVPIVAIRRQRVGDEERFHEDSAIVDIGVTFCDRIGLAVFPEIDDEETDDEGDGTFGVLGKTQWKLTAPQSHNENQSFMDTANSGHSVRGLGSAILLVKRNVPLGFCDAAFATRVLDRFPHKNYKGLPLPEEELPMFCYPTGCRLHRAQFSDAPLAQYYGFCVKNERGDSIYVSCVSFMEPLTKSKLNQLAIMSESRRRVSLPHRFFWENQRRLQQQRVNGLASTETNLDGDGLLAATFEDESNLLLTGFDEMTTFENKTICLVSRYPYWTAFRRFLSHLHILSGSSSDLPLERCISHLLLAVPIPKPGGPSILIPLPTLNAPMVLSAPPLKDLPVVDLPFERLMACLDIPTIVTIVLGFLALERKVIVMSTRPSLVLDVCELLRSLLFPFDLCAPYVPRLTEPFMSCLDFPGAIFVGIHDDGSSDGLAAVVRKNMPEDSTIVDLDCGSVDCSGDRVSVLNSSWGVIPPDSRAVLVSELETLCRDAGIAPGQEPLDSQIDSAFDASIPPSLVHDEGTAHVVREPLDDRAVRDSFLRFFCSVLGGYERYLVVPDVDFLISGNEWFDAKGFLSSASEDKAVFLGALVSTQLFQSFIQRRTEASDVHCLLFDECLQEYHSSPIPYGRLGGDVETVTSSENGQPQMLYSLLVDQSATETQLAMSTTDKSFDVDSQHGSDTDSSALPPAARSTLSASETSDRPKYFDFAVNASGDWVTVPSRQDLAEGERFVYCVEGNPTFPDQLDPNLYLPQQPESWLVEMSEAPSPLLARSEKELEEADRRRKLATSYRGLQSQRRCLWQLPKLMGSHFLGSWLLCIPSQVSQPHLSHDQQSKYLLRALGALRLLRSRQRIVPDEAAYRALMVACGRTKNDRRTELVRLFGLLRSDGIFPSAMTLGQYTRALAEGYSKRATGTPDEDVAGVEVTESASRDLRVGAVRRGAMDAEVALSALDGTLANLEEAGRRWRQKNAPEKDTGQPGDDKSTSNDSKSAPVERQKKRISHKPWLPVVFSSSFVPAKLLASGTQETRPLRATDIRLIAIWSRTKSCDSCSYIPLEEEIQAGWDVVGGENDIPGAINCPRCGSLLIPMLGYREMTIDEALNNGEDARPTSTRNGGVADFDSLPPQIGPVLETPDASYVTYISPTTLRLSLERHIAENGEEVLDREHLKSIDPELFYNFWWYCARFSLPLPLPIKHSDGNEPRHSCLFAAWDHRVADRGCHSCAKSLTPYLVDDNSASSMAEDDVIVEPVESFEDFPLISRFNLQGFYSSVWDHDDLSEILVTLVEACDKRDFRPVVECVLRCNKRRQEKYGGLSATSSSEVNSSFTIQNRSVVAESPVSNVDLDCYRTILYLAKYQCTSAFHAFFPASLKPCKGYHYWCPQAPLPIFDRLLREAVKRVHTKDSAITPMHDISDIALAFRGVFGHII